MTRDDAAALLTRALREVAPEADVRAIDADGLLQEEAGLDSIDFLNVVNIVGDETGSHIPERDFPALATFRGFVAYLVSGIRAPGPAMTASRDVTLPDGRTLVVRAAGPADAEGVALMYAGLSDDDLHLRFFSTYHPPREFFDRIVNAAAEGGCCLVAAIEDPVPRVVGEAEYHLLPNGNGELAITVAPDWRGWLGPYLLDALLDAAAAQGVPNLEAEVLVENRRMLAVIRRRGYATVHGTDFSEVRLVVGTSGATPTWAAAHDCPRVLAESRGTWWSGERALNAAGIHVMVCPGPHPGSRPDARCPALAGEPCPLVAGADVVVCALPGGPDGDVRAAHGTVHPGARVIVPGAAARPGEFALGSTSDDALVGLVQRILAARRRTA